MKNRSNSIQEAEAQEFDVLIIGGGVTGAGIALDAVSRGLKTCLIEMQDFAGGTSSRSTKLIHGGLRYIKQLHFKLVYQTGRERAILHRNARHLVHPEKMLLPVVEGGSLGRGSSSLALFIYDLLAGVKKEDRKKKLSKEEALNIEPLLPKKRLKGGIIFSEYRTDDARLTIELIKKAKSLGATCINYMQAEQFVEKNGRLTAIKAKDLLSGNEHIFSAEHFINSCGVWTDKVWNLGEEKKPPILLPSKGVHLVFKHASLPINKAIYFDAPDDRMIFAIPRAGTTYVGTTDKAYSGDLKDPPLLEGEVEYLLSALNSFFDGMELEKKDVISHWVGLRPLIKERGKKAGEISRRDEIFESKNGLISITGGKLTGYRLMAKKSVDLLMRRKGKKARCRTRGISLGEKNFKSYAAVNASIDHLSNMNPWMDNELARYLVHTYGHAAQGILGRLPAQGNQNRLELAMAELSYCIEHESVQTWDDFAIRRTAWRYFHPDWEKEYKAALMLKFPHLR